MHVKLSSGARALIFGLNFHLLIYFMYARSKGSSDTLICEGLSTLSFLEHVIST